LDGYREGEHGSHDSQRANGRRQVLPFSNMLLIRFFEVVSCFHLFSGFSLFGGILKKRGNEEARCRARFLTV
jgi:hypothetical protein